MDLEEWRIATVDGWLAGIAPGSRVLELGAGTGQMAKHVQKLGYSVTAIDLSPGNVAAMVDLGVDATEADFADLPFADGTYPAAFAINSLLHVPRDELPDVYAEIRRVLTVGASLMVVVWGGEDSEGPYTEDWLDPPRFFNFFTDEALWTQPTPGFEKRGLDVLEDAVSKKLRSQVLTLEAV